MEEFHRSSVEKPTSRKKKREEGGFAAATLAAESLVRADQAPRHHAVIWQREEAPRAPKPEAPVHPQQKRLESTVATHFSQPEQSRPIPEAAIVQAIQHETNTDDDEDDEHTGVTTPGATTAKDTQPEARSADTNAEESTAAEPAADDEPAEHVTEQAEVPAETGEADSADAELSEEELLSQLDPTEKRQIAAHFFKVRSGELRSEQPEPQASETAARLADATLLEKAAAQLEADTTVTPEQAIDAAYEQALQELDLQPLAAAAAGEFTATATTSHESDPAAAQTEADDIPVSATTAATSGTPPPAAAGGGTMPPGPPGSPPPSPAGASGGFNAMPSYNPLRRVANTVG